MITTPKKRRGRRAQHVYAIGKFAFVQHPILNGLWIRTDTSVLKVDCEMCGAKVFHPCLGTSKRDKGEPVSYTHYPRRSAARRKNVPNSTTIITVQA